ncbi:MAG TPA: alpha/beta fold hydrolase [Bacteroidota bacterium]|nr:alpha/beta fold hydrolase [Bacteroidota bacterium]
MKINSHLFYFLIVIGLSAARPMDASAKNVAGIWQGTLKVQALELRVVFHIQSDSAAGLQATLDSPDQGAKGIPVDNVSYRLDSLVLTINAIGGAYQGIVQPGDSVVIGMWKQQGAALPLELHRVRAVAEIGRLQEPKPPFPYDAEEVSYENRDAGVTLAGTFTRPRDGAPFPALLLITGSGPQNRDEELFGHKPFLVIADYLTKRGIAVLRVDDRGTGRSTGVFSGATTKDFAGDVRAGINYLKSRSDVNGKKIGLLGHSEGGIIAPMIASESNDVAFIVMMAGPALPGDQILYLQDSLVSAAMGVSPEEIMKELRLNRILYSLIREESDTAKLAQKIRSAVEESMSGDSASVGTINHDAVNAAVRQLTSPWFKFFVAYDPLPALEKVQCPVLALDGSKDLQVPPEVNVERLEFAFKTSGNKNAVAKLLPGLNHLFQKAETGAPLEYGKIEETVDPEALKVIGDWIDGVTK